MWDPVRDSTKQFVEDLGEGVGERDGEVPGGGPEPGAGGSAGGSQGAEKRNPVGINTGPISCGRHQRADGVVGAQMPVDLLYDPVGGFGAQHHPRTALMGLELIKGGFELPPLGVEGSEFVGRGGNRVEDGGDQPVTLGCVTTGVVECDSADETKELVTVSDGYRESSESWAEVLRELKARGMAAPVLAVADCALGLWNALGQVWPATLQQRCWVHYADFGIMPICGGGSCRRAA